jgi:secreted trypsin-like serine protease
VGPQTRSTSLPQLIIGLLGVLALVGAFAASQLIIASRSPVGHPVSGIVAVLDVRPAQADDAFAGFVCTGVAVGPRQVMTAAHCVTGRAPMDLVVGAGLSRLCGTHLSDVRTFAIDAVEINPAYDAKSGRSDLAVLHLDSAVDASAVRQTTGDFPIGQTLHAFGWGSPVGGSPGCDLLRTDVRALDASGCAALAIDSRAFDARTMACGSATDPASDTCHGDSGGPLVVGDPEHGPVAAVVSWGTCEGLGAYARIDSWHWSP